MTIHRKENSIIIAEDKRSLRRPQLLEHDNFTMTLMNKIEARIIDLTSSGAKITINRKFGANSALASGEIIQHCNIYSNKILIGQYPSIVICHIYSSVDAEITIGIKFFSQALDPHISQSIRGLRDTDRIIILDKFLPRGYFNDPLQYNNIIYFRVENFSKSGAKIIYSSRNRNLLQNTLIKNMHFNLPTVGNLEIDAIVSWTKSTTRKNEIEAGINFLSKPKNFDDYISRYLISFGAHQYDLPLRLQKAKLKPKNTKSSVEYSIAMTQDDYLQVLKLRKESYSRVGKISAETDVLTLADEYDQRSNIVIAKHRGIVVGSIRFTYCVNNEDSFELEKSIILPSKFNRTRTLEASRASISEYFENTNLIHGLFEFGAQLAIKSAADWVITSCEPKLYTLYSRLGFKKQGVNFNLKTLNNLPHVLIAASTKVIATSDNLNPLIWHFSYKPVAQHLVSLGYINKIQLTLYKNIIYYMGRILLKIAALFRKFRN